MRKAGLAFAAILGLTFLAQAQDDGRFDFAVNYSGVFSKTVTSSNRVVSDKPTTSGGLLISFRYHGNRMHGLELNVGHTSNAQIFTISPDTYRVQASIIEYSGAYVFSPFASDRVRPFLLAGAGGLRFDPGNTYIDGTSASFGAAKQTSLAFLYGAGLDYHLWRALGLRLQYRGLIYKNPDFKVSRLFTSAKGHMAEPSAGIVFRF